MNWNDKDNFLEILENKRRFGVFLDMGVGKTALLLALIDQKIFEGVQKILIIAPKKVSLSTWQDEIKKWQNFRYLYNIVELIDGDEEERVEKLKKTGDFCVHIISSSQINWLHGEKVRKGKTIKFVPNKHRPNYDMIIVDECSQFKDPTTQRYKSLQRISDGKHLFLLSGTLFSNITFDEDDGTYLKADELYYVMRFLGIYNHSLTNFRDSFMFTKPWEQYTHRMNKNIYDMLNEEIDKVSIKKTLKLKVKLQHHLIYCPVDAKRLKDLKRDYYLETNNLHEVTAQNRAIMINKSLQLANGFVYDDRKQVFRFNSYKMTALKGLLAELERKNAGNVIVLYNFKEDKDYIIQEIPEIVVYTDEAKAKWNNNEIKYLLISPLGERYGLNLQQGGHILIFYGLMWSAESLNQLIARLFRTGQEHDVDVYFILARDSFDDYVYKKLSLKTEAIKEFMSEVKKFMQT